MNILLRKSVLAPRLYRDERDMDSIRALQIAGRAANNGTYYMHRGDVDWGFYYPPNEDDRRKNLLLWEDAAGELLAWGVHSPEDDSADFLRTQHCEAMIKPQTWSLGFWLGPRLVPETWAEASYNITGRAKPMR